MIEVRLGITASPKILYSVLFNRVNPFNLSQGMIARKLLLSLLFFVLYLHLHSTKSPTDLKGLSLSGSVRLEGQMDHSGVTVALYALAELDTMVLRMNKEFHTVGMPIFQATEFDHRLAKPIYQTQTKAEGSYKLEGIKEGTYNLVAIKQGYGWKYLYEVELGKGTEKENAENMVLYPEMEVSGTTSQCVVWPSKHHIIGKGDITVQQGTDN